jgi:arabinose-5-phosphate isomerase
MISTLNTSTIQATALATLTLEAQSIQNLTNYIDTEFVKAVEILNACKGRVVVSGIGKSAVIAQKIAVTFHSTGTPSLFLHAADAIHGDLGMVQQHDVVIIISKSGESPEIKVLVPLIKNFNNTIIAICGSEKSHLATHADVFVNTTVTEEACPNNLAPTSSTTAQLAMGDALAVCLMELKGFTNKDFARYHPGGALGKKLYLTVNDLCQTHQPPQVLPSSTLKQVIVEISNKRLGATAVVNEHNQLLGIITDGDLRRLLEKETVLTNITAQQLMTTNPKTINAQALAVEALELMKDGNITQLLVTNKQGTYQGIIHLHDIVKEGII